MGAKVKKVKVKKVKSKKEEVKAKVKSAVRITAGEGLVLVGEIVKTTEDAITLRWKKPRSSKTFLRTVPMSQVVAYAKGGSKKGDVVVLKQPMVVAEGEGTEIQVKGNTAVVVVDGVKWVVNLAHASVEHSVAE